MTTPRFSRSALLVAAAIFASTSSFGQTTGEPPAGAASEPRADQARQPPSRASGGAEAPVGERGREDRRARRDASPRSDAARSVQETPARANHDASPRDEQDASAADQAEPSSQRPPADATTRHSLALPDRTLNFAAQAGSVRLTDEKGEPEADIAYVYYRLDDADPKTRPIAFFFNGGPGSASAWLQLGAAGPWRLPMSGEALSPSASPELAPNAETWLDFADLVFIDPVNTGFSRFATRDEAARKRLLSVDGDARAVAQAIRRVTQKADRLLSPKFIVGESYGGVRGPKVAHELVARQGVGVRGLILISPVLDFRPFGDSNLLQNVWTLPSMTAAAREARQPVSRADLADVEAYAAGEYAVDLLRGQADAATTERVAARVASFTGIDSAIVRRAAGRLSPSEFRRELARSDKRVAGAYDASVFGRDPFPEAAAGLWSDPASDPLTAPMTSAIVELTTRRLHWRARGAYALLNRTVSQNWDWGHGLNPPESLTQLRLLLALDPQFKVLVGHGLFDLVTPYFGSKILLDQLPDFGGGRVKLTTLPGGHMFYSRDASRRDFRAQAQELMK